MAPKNTDFDAEATLTRIYEEIMWLAKRPSTSPSAARAWYTHIASNRLRRYLRTFTGQVSQQALQPGAVLRLEHFKRLQTTLTKLVTEHLRNGTSDPSQFIRVISDCEQVHIVTAPENYAAMKADGDYAKAGIVLVAWENVALETQLLLWKRVLTGRVSNASDFNPTQRTVHKHALQRIAPAVAEIGVT